MPSKDSTSNEETDEYNYDYDDFPVQCLTRHPSEGLPQKSVISFSERKQLWFRGEDVLWHIAYVETIRP